MGAVIILIYLGVIVAVIAGGWKMFEKAGEPGWTVLVPIYNAYVLNKMCGKDTGFFILSFIPCVSIYWSWVITQELAKRFNQSEGFGIGLFFLSPVFVPILGFGDAQWVGGQQPAMAGGYAAPMPGVAPPTGAAPAAPPSAAPAAGAAEPTTAGWYPDPWGQATQRYHDGSQWTGHTA